MNRHDYMPSFGRRKISHEVVFTVSHSFLVPILLITCLLKQDSPLTTLRQWFIF